MGRRAQAWSMDLIIGVLIFMLAVGVIYSLLVSRNSDDVVPLRIESEVIANKLSDDPMLAIASGNQLDIDKFSTLAFADYELLKAQLGVQSEFCVFLRDEHGNITLISNATADNEGYRFTGIGSKNGELNLTCMKNCIQQSCYAACKSSSDPFVCMDACSIDSSERHFACGEEVPPRCEPC